MAQRVYKITRPNLTTFNRFQYVVGQTYNFSGQGSLCGPGWSHACTSAQLAVLLNPIHANYKPYRLWQASGVVGATDYGLKVGCSSITLEREVVVPKVWMEQRVQFGIYCALEVYTEASFVAWATEWLSGKRRAAEAYTVAFNVAPTAAAKAAYAAAFAATPNTTAFVPLNAANAADAAVYAAVYAARAPSFLDYAAQSALMPWDPR